MTLVLLLAFSSSMLAQEAGTAPSAEEASDESTVILSPFVVSSEIDSGYQATETLAGTRLRTNLSDIGSAVSVITKEFLADLGAYDNEGVLAYVTNVEVGGANGNFLNPAISGGRPQESGLLADANSNTRVRGLQRADNTRDFFLTDVPWDGYNVSRVDIQRGPNAILFGLGSPAGIINATSDTASVSSNRGEAQVRTDKFGSLRSSLNVNRVLLKDELGVRLALLKDDQKFRQDPAFEDDQRVYAALTYRPKMLNGRNNTFAVSGNWEKADIDSNRPRFTTPIDYITPFVTPVTEGGQGGRTFNLFDIANGVSTPNVAGSADYTPWYSTNFNDHFPMLVGNSAGSANSWQHFAVYPNGARSANGTILLGDTFAGGPPASTVYGAGGNFSFSTMARYPDYALRTNVPFASAGFVNERGLSDPSIFDFYNKLMDGSNKQESQDWDIYNFNVSQTFWNHKAGWDFSYFNQKQTTEQRSILGGEHRIEVDLDEVLPDSSANPNVGRAYVSENSSGQNRDGIHDRDSWRLQAFLEHDFARENRGFLAKLMGRHRLTGVRLNQYEFQDNRSFNRLVVDNAYRTKVTAQRVDGNDNRIGARYYISGDLRGTPGTNGLNFSNITERLFEDITQPVSVHYFDTAWAPQVNSATGTFWNPGDPWTPANADYPANANSTTFITQSQNPANYTGWTQGNFNWISPFSGSQADRDYATTGANMSSFEVDSNVFVWQGFLWNDAIVGTYGYREDKSYRNIVQAALRDDGGRDVRPSVFNLDAGSISEQSTTNRNWSAVVHLHKLFPEKLPVNISLFYNEGENFQPSAGRLDYFSHSLPPPQGSTRDQGVLVSTKDGRYSLRVNKYEATIVDSTITRSFQGFRMEQALWVPGVFLGRHLEGNLTWLATTYPHFDQIDEIMAAHLQFQKDLAATFPDFIDAWLRQGTWGPSSPNLRVGLPPGTTNTEDSLSKGWEIELTANPTKNWRLAVNASKTTAIRDNVPGDSITQLVNFIDNAYRNTLAGMMPNSGTAPETLLEGRWSLFWADWTVLQTLNGQKQPEVRDWRLNAVTNYRFTEGRLRGLGLGASYRYESPYTIGYAPYFDDLGNAQIDLANPYKSKAESRVDLNISYGRKLTERLGWRIQLNVYNAFQNNKLLPITVQADGTPGSYRIQEGTSWAVTNTLSF